MLDSKLPGASFAWAWTAWHPAAKAPVAGYESKNSVEFYQRYLRSAQFANEH